MAPRQGEGGAPRRRRYRRAGNYALSEPLLADSTGDRKEIAVRLFTLERTVDSHVRSILNKLGLNSRTQIAAWVAATPGSAAPTD